MSILIAVCIVLGYISLVLELYLLHVPSVASNRAIWSADSGIIEGYSSDFQWIFKLSKLAKLLFFFIPLLGVYFVFLLPLLIVFGQTYFSSAMLFPQTLLISVLGIILIVLGRYITIQSALTMRKSIVLKDEQFKLNTKSFFGRSRNPTQLGMYIFLCGIILCIPSLWLVLGLLYYVSYMHVKINMEENFLTKQFGKKYLDYVNNTRRYW
jgi:protein-S-isoprenylcysteine O-methyltransferase Ste14